MMVVKRDGREVLFDRNKIVSAVEKAFKEIDGQDSVESCRIATRIAEQISRESGGKKLGVEEIQDSVEGLLMKSERPDVARAYIIYRNQRTKIRESKSKIVQDTLLRSNAMVDYRSNANVDESSFSGREKEASADLGKTIALEFGGLSEDVANAHKEMLVYQHDLEKTIYGVHNCLNLNFQEIFQNGFRTRNGDVRPPTSFSTACQLVAVAFQCQSQVQFGGVGSIHLDYDLAPFVKKSFFKHYEDGLKYIAHWSDEESQKLIKCFVESGVTINDESLYADDLKQIYEYARAMLEKEGKQSAQGLYHNLNTLESRQGSQVPFTSINVGRDTSTEGRLVTRWILEASLDGIGKHHLTSIFPISIFQYKKGVNAKPSDPNYDLKQLALKSMSRRIYPNWCNGDWSQAHEEEDNPDTFFSTMGCRTLVGYDRHGLSYIRQGRGNNVPNTIILPKLGIEFGICLGKRTEPDLKGFWNAFEEALKLCEKGLLERFRIMASQSPKSAPFMYQNNTMQDTQSCVDNVYNALRHNTLLLVTLEWQRCVRLYSERIMSEIQRYTNLHFLSSRELTNLQRKHPNETILIFHVTLLQLRGFAGQL